MSDDLALDNVKRYGDAIHIDLWYPRVEGNARFLRVGLVDVRAADDIRISYDFQRDGWRIEQASIFTWEPVDEAFDPGWKEAAFVPAWQFLREREEHPPMPEPTPGRWTYLPPKAVGGATIELRSDAEHEANARLVAAAPDLLAACRAMRDAWYSGRDIDRIVNLNGALDRMEAAIARAEGRGPTDV